MCILRLQGPLNTFTSSAPTLTLPHSLAENNLTNRGQDMSGVLKLAEALPQSKLQSLKCAAAHVLAFCVQRPLNTCTFPTHKPFLLALPCPFPYPYSFPWPTSFT